MSSFSSSILPRSTCTKNKTNFSFSPLLFSKTSSHCFEVLCNAAADDNNKKNYDITLKRLILPKTPSLELHQQQQKNIDRRNFLVSLGGMYAAANLTSIPSSAFSVPIQAPDDIWDCYKHEAYIRNRNMENNPVRDVNCCAPEPAANARPIEDYKFPPRNGRVLRVRRPAHLASMDPVFVRKYQRAIGRMKSLPDSDPRSWKNQAKIHCAYCCGSYTQEHSGRDDVILDIHFSSLFFPFHRWYLYFHERILASLIDDPTFALPYWNWDNPTGMRMPKMFIHPMCLSLRNEGYDNSLYNPYRDPAHLNTLITLDGNQDVINRNLGVLHRQMVNSVGIRSFLGGVMSAGPVERQGGSIENGAHISIHRWTGDSRTPYHEDMGSFYSAAYDPIFYSHHANVDRMWYLWRHQLNNDANINPTTDECRNRPHVDGCYTPSDWEDSSFVFYDEERNLVRVYNRDCVDIERMGYTYVSTDIGPWRDFRPKVANPEGLNVVAALNFAAAGVNTSTLSIGPRNELQNMMLPFNLGTKVKLLVKRPAINRTNEEKNIAREILYINGIEFDGSTSFKFDVFINDVDDGTPINVSNTEFVGSFEQLQRGPGGPIKMSTGAMFGITEILEHLKVDKFVYVPVALVPNFGCENVTVYEVKIDLINVR